MDCIFWSEVKKLCGVSNEELVKLIRSEQLPAYWMTTFRSQTPKRVNPKRKAYNPYLSIMFDVRAIIEVVGAS